MTVPTRSSGLVLLSLLALAVSLPQSLKAEQTAQSEALSAAQRHQDPQWLSIQSFLPDPATATPEKLELAADVLRARRMPEDALDFYAYALRRGGDDARIMNKMGITELDLLHLDRASAYFRQVVKRHNQDAEAWNNLGAVEHVELRFRSAISDYNRAVKLNKTTAVYHSNLATAYFAIADFEMGRKEFEKAIRLDPRLFEHSSSSGTTAHMLTAGDRGRVAFEMARLFALAGDETAMLHSLTESAESGYEVLSHMSDDPVLRRYCKDQRVLVLLKNTRSLHSPGDSVASVGIVPTLPAPVKESR